MTKDDDKAANDNTPFDEKAWRKDYMKRYMVEWRRRQRLKRDSENSQNRPLPPPEDRKGRWTARAEKLMTLADDMTAPEPRAMMQRLAAEYDWRAGGIPDAP